MSSINKQSTIKTILITMVLLPLLSHAQTCRTDNIEATTPNSRFEILGNGSEVKDKQTRLIWQRCSIGQTWNGTTCTGEAKQYIWKQALTQAKALGNGYRLPNIKELNSIVEQQCHAPTINGEIFPNTPPNWYWSSSPIANINAAWGVNFYYGSTINRIKYTNYYVRAVRSGN